MRQPLQFICFLIGALLLVNSLFLFFRTNFNLGTILPALVGLPLIFTALFYNKLSGGSGFWFFIRTGLIAGYSVLIVVLVLIAGLMLHQLRQKPDPKADALVVLGAAVFGDQVSLTLASRLDTALAYWQKHPELLIVVCGGQGPDEDVTEAYAMSKYLALRGVPPDKLLLEDQSVNTRENLRYARDHLLEALAEKKTSDSAAAENTDAGAASSASHIQACGASETQVIRNVTSGDLNESEVHPSDVDHPKPNIIIVTSSYHVLRAVDTAENIGFTASSLGAPVLWYLLPGDFLRESLALVYFFIFGQ